MVVEEGTPSLRRRLAEPDHVLADAGLSDVDAEFEEFTVDTRRTPQRVFAAHGADQLANVFRNARTTVLAMTDFPPPEKPKALPVPGYDGFRLDDNQSGTPVAPGPAKPGPQEPIGWGRRTPSWWRRASFSTWRSARDLKPAKATATDK